MIIIKQAVCEERFNALYGEYYSIIYKYCLSRLNCNREYAEDCVQDTFVVAYKKIASGEEIQNPRSFLYTTATNFIKKRYNEIQKHNDSIVNIDDYEYLLKDNNIDNLIGTLDFNEFSRKLEASLSEDELILFRYRFVEELRIKDIADILHITPANCSLKVTRLRRKILAGLKEYL